MLGGTSPANDCTLTITSVDGIGHVDAFTLSGTHVNLDYSWSFNNNGVMSAPGNIVAVGNVVVVRQAAVEAERFGLINQRSLGQLGRMGGRWSWR